MLSIISVRYHTGDSIVILIWILVSFYFPTPDWRKREKPLCSLSSGKALLLVSWRQLLFQGFILKRAWCYELRTEINSRPLSGKREAEVARATGRRLSKTLERDQRLWVSQEMETCIFFPQWPLCRMAAPEEGAAGASREAGSQAQGVPHQARFLSPKVLQSILPQGTVVDGTVILVIGMDWKPGKSFLIVLSAWDPLCGPSGRG